MTVRASTGISLLGAFLISSSAVAEAPKAYIIEPSDGETVTSPVKVSFGLQGMGVAPAGVEQDGTGHHHLLINVDALPPSGQPIPADDQHVHFGGGQTQTQIELEPGEHTLQLLLGDHLHRPHDEPVKSEKIKIHVE